MTTMQKISNVDIFQNSEALKMVPIKNLTSRFPKGLNKYAVFDVWKKPDVGVQMKNAWTNDIY